MKKLICIILAAAALFLSSCGTLGTVKLPETENNVIEQLPNSIETTTAAAEQLLNSIEPTTAAAEQLEEEPTTDNLTDFVLNKRSLKIHYPSCHYVAQMAEKNKEYVRANLEDLKQNGYDPCYNCCY